MAKFTKKIGWQKYEDYIEKQLSSPLLNTVVQNIASQYMKLDTDEDLEEEEEEDILESFEDKSSLNTIPLLPVTQQMIEDISMLSSFDCWIGHTNFDLTPSTKEILNSVPGVELLKICSRYRFFIGIGTMFDFTQVRNDIEKALFEEGD